LTMTMTMTTYNLLQAFNLIGSDMWREILPYLESKDSLMLHSVCRFFYKVTIPQLRCIILCIQNALDKPPDFSRENSEFRKATRKFMSPFLYPQIEFHKLGQPLKKPEFPIVAISTANYEIPEEIDTSQLCCIENSLKGPILLKRPRDWIRLRDITLENSKFLCYLNSNHIKLPKLAALIMRNNGISLPELQKCKAIPKVKYVNIEGSFMNDQRDRIDDHRQNCFNFLELEVTMNHHNSGLNLPEIFFLEKLTLHIEETNFPPSRFPLHFEANLHKSLEDWKVHCKSTTFFSKVKFGLHNTSSLKLFDCNATQKQATFTVYGTEDDNGVFIPGNDDWVLDLRKIVTRHDFRWFVEIKKGKFKTRCFNDVPLRKDVIIGYYGMLFPIEVSPSYSAIEHNHKKEEQKRKERNYKKKLQKKNRKKLQQQQQQSKK